MVGSCVEKGMGAAIAAMMLAGVACAEEPGEAAYEANCATCHGLSGEGDGPLAQYLALDTPDLTTLAQRNNGAFPTLNVVHIIDGRSGLRGHGSDMPIWGDRFKTDHAGLNGDYGEIYAVRGRILSIVYYLEAIQK